MLTSSSEQAIKIKVSAHRETPVNQKNNKTDSKTKWTWPNDELSDIVLTQSSYYFLILLQVSNLDNFYHWFKHFLTALSGI